MPDPLVSVIVPNYNYGAFLRECVDSILGQDLASLEVIVVDDGSTDESAAVLDSISDGRLRTLQSGHLGVSAARNLGLDHATGEYLAFLDADDRWHPNKLAAQVRLAQEANLDIVFCNFRRFDDSGFLPKDHFSYFPDMQRWPSRTAQQPAGVVLLGDAFEILAPQPFLAACLSATIFKRASLGNLRFPVGMRIAEDWHYLLRALEQAAVGYIDRPLVDIRRHGNNTYGRNEDLAPMTECLFDVEQCLKSGDHRRTVRRKRGLSLLGLGYFNLREGRILTGASAYARALAYEGSRLNAARHLAMLPAYAVDHLLRRPRN